MRKNGLIRWYGKNGSGGTINNFKSSLPLRDFEIKVKTSKIQCKSETVPLSVLELKAALNRRKSILGALRAKNEK